MTTTTTTATTQKRTASALSDSIDNACEFYPKMKEREKSLAEIDRRLPPCPSVTCLSPLDRWRLLQQYFPRDFVNAYTATIKTEDTTATTDKPVAASTTTTTVTYEISHDELIEALQKAPHLVVQETAVERYIYSLCDLRTSKDPIVVKEAARKIAMHWKVRKYFFRERAFLPMAMSDSETGFEGALSAEDVEWFNRGWIIPLNSAGDRNKEKRSMVIVDATTLPSDHKSNPKYEMMKVRVAFCRSYNGSVRYPSQSIVTISVLATDPSLYYTHWTSFVIREAMPAKKIELHVLFLPSKIRESLLSFAVKIAKNVMLWIGSYLNGVKFHMGYTDESVLQRLATACNFDRAYIPWDAEVMDWDPKAFQLIFKELKKVEQESYSYLAHEVEPPICRRKQSEKERSKRRRMTAKNKFEELQKQAKDLKVEQEGLKNENRRLEKLVEYAKTEVFVLDGLETDGFESPGAVDLITAQSPELLFEEPTLDDESIFDGNSLN